jgi:predicted nucleotidyltransferase
MLTKKDRAIAEEFRRRVADVLPVIAVRAFGSRVRRRHAPDSDLNIFIEVESVTPEQRRRISEVAWEVGFDAGYVISTFVVTRHQIEHGMEGANPLVINALAEGERL